MKINIQIEDASPEELQRLFAQAPGITFVPARPKIKEEFLAHPPPLPTTTTTTPITPNSQTVPTPVTTVTKAPKKTPGNKSNKFGIPPGLLKSDKRAYDRAWAYCKAHGITYDKIEEYKAAKKAGRAKKSPKVKQSIKAIALSNESTEPAIKIEGADALVDKMPEIRPPTGEAHKRVAEVRAAAAKQSVPDDFKVGAHVKQIKPYYDRTVSGIGVVTARVNGLVEVNFSGHQYYKIAPDCLEVV